MLMEDINHEELLSGSSLKIGKIHWYIQKADTEMNERVYKDTKEKGPINLDEIILTDFGKDVGFDYINWWVFKKEPEIEELLKRTKDTLISVQKLKEDSSSLKAKYYPESYSDLVKKIKEFTDSHKKEINALYDYVIWLHKKDVLAPSILFTYRVWGSTNLGDREVKILSNNIDEDSKSVKICTEFALGLRVRFRYTIENVYWDILSDVAESTDPEYQVSISVPEKPLIVQTSHKVLEELATYFESIRQSLRNIILDIKRYNAQTELLYRESFWRSFATKAMGVNRIENQLWDFKETLEMWHTKHKDKEEAEFKFCEQVTALANTSGGVLIVGITDKLPRKIVGIQDLENKLKFTKEVINRHVNYDTDFVHFQQILMTDENEKERSCLIIKITQTKDVISVKDKSGKISYPIRLETGLVRRDYNKIKNSKINVLHDNHNFILNLDRFLHNR